MQFSVRATSTYCFVGTGSGPAQVVWVELAPAEGRSAVQGQAVRVSLSGPDISCAKEWEGALPDQGAVRAEVAFVVREGRGPLAEGEVIEVEVAVSVAERSAERSSHQLLAHEPGWVMHMVSHFHYDPVWWNTQAGYTSAWDELLWAQDNRDTFQHNGLVLVESHLERARLEPTYKFVLAEVDYLQPFWQLYPDRRDEIRALLDQGRLEIVGGTYNEPNTNLVGYETAARCAVYGLGFQRDVMGANPRTAWQLDVFAHDPSFPSLMALAGVGSSSWARGPFHQWGPKHHTGSTEWMQFPSEFEWVGPDGGSLVTSYMADHYSAGWQLDAATTIDEAMSKAYELFCDLAAVSAGKNLMLPVGTDYTPPNRWVTRLARAWSEKYVSPVFVPALPRDFFASLDAEAVSEAGKGLEVGTGRRRAALLPQTREMGPVYTGKDVSFIDTKQANRLTEQELAEAETWSSFALALGHPYPHRALDKAWRQVVFNSHHDGITGSESDQVYLDLLAGWREAFELAREAKESALDRLASAVAGDTAGSDGVEVVVFNRMSHPRTGVVRARVPVARGAGGGVRVVTASGEAVACVAATLPAPAGTGARREGAPGMLEVLLDFLAEDVPAMGWRCYRVAGSSGSLPEWEAFEGVSISNEHLRVEASATRGGCLSSVTELASGRDLLAPGEVANDIVVYDEYPTHPQMSEGPWHLMPRQEVARSSRAPATVVAQHSPLGQRLVITGEVAGTGYRQVVSLFRGHRRAEVTTYLSDYRGVDRLVRLRFGFCQPGATPLAETGQSVIGRTRGLVGHDSAEYPWTLDSPAQNWAGVGPCLVARLGADGVGASLGVGEIVLGDTAGDGTVAATRSLMVSMLQRGVTASCGRAGANRYGGLAGDSNLPDFRISAGAPQSNAFTAAVLGAAGDAYAREFDRQLQASGRARLYVPPLAGARTVAGAVTGTEPVVDVRSELDLPVFVVCGTDEESTAAQLAALAEEISATGGFGIDQPAQLIGPTKDGPTMTGAVLNRGTPGHVVGADGALYVSVLRSCTGWPSGVWIDPPRRTAPDGTNFELEHWDHVFEHAIVGGEGDWRQVGIAREGREFNSPLAHRVVRPRPGEEGPGLGSQGSFLEVRNDNGDAFVSGSRPLGHPLARGTLGPDGSLVQPEQDGAGTLVLGLRAHESAGYPAALSFGGAGLFPVLSVERVDLMETSVPRRPPAGEGSAAPVALGACQVVNLAIVLGAAPGAVGAVRDEPPSSRSEAVQPVYSRYWLHNKGPAPMGNGLLAVHANPMALAVTAGQQAEFSVTVSSSATCGAQAGEVVLDLPSGWSAEHPAPVFSLSPGAFRRIPVVARVPARCRPGRYFVAARVRDGDGQLMEDVVTVDVAGAIGDPGIGGDGGAAGDGHAPAVGALFAGGHQTFSPQVGAEMEMELLPDLVEVGPGATGTARLRLRNRTRSEVRAEVQLVSPWETWEYVRPWVQEVVVGPGEEAVAVAEVTAPSGGPVLSSWCLFKVMYFGRVWYSPCARLELVTPAPSGLR